jgi:hypothetical protein
MACVSGLTSANGAAIAGIRNASDKLDQAAANVARAGFEAEDSVSVSDGARAASRPDTQTGEIATAMVDMRVAKYQQAASVAVLRTSDEMTTDLLTLGGAKKGG